MSQKNTDNKTESKSFQHSLKDLPIDNVIIQTNKSNRIVIDSNIKFNEIKDFDNYNEQKMVKNTSTVEKTKFSNSVRFDLDSNGNEIRLTGNSLPPLKNKKSLEEGKFSRTMYKNDKATVKSLKKKLNELNGEIKKLRNDSNVQNYNILELNYKQKSKELTELKQENNFIRFQLEDMIRKNTKNNNVKNNNFLNNKENKKKSAGKMGSIRDYHIQLFSQKIKIEEDNKKMLDDEIKNDMNLRKIEELKRRIDTANKDNEKLKKMFNMIKTENEELKHNIIRLNDNITLMDQKNNNDNFEKNELNLKIHELTEEKENLKNELNNIKKSSDKNKNSIIEENNKYKKEISELKKLVDGNIDNQKDEYIKEIKEE